VRYIAVTACPTGIAHTYMAAEKLSEAAELSGDSIKVETQGSIGAENVLTEADVAEADGVIIAADLDIDLDRFAGKRVLVTSVADGISRPGKLMEDVLEADIVGAPAPAQSAADAPEQGSSGSAGRFGGAYRALMNGVTHMIPFVVTGGLLIAISLSMGGEASQTGLAIPAGTFWDKVFQIGVLSFTLMIPILSGYIAFAIADRPGLVPGMIGGFIANTGSLYDSEAGAGFLGAILTGFAAGYLALGLKKIKVPNYVRPIMPIIVIPIVATLVLGLSFIYILGSPIASLFEALTNSLTGMQGSSVVVLGIVLGAMIAFDMGGPVNKTAFLFAGGLIATGNTQLMGMVAAAIAVPPLGMGLATLIRRGLFSLPERESGIAALFMGFFGITEGAIPFAAADPVRVIPANILGGATAGAIAALTGVGDAVMHGGPIVAVFGAVSTVFGFLLAIIIGTVVTAFVTVVTKELHEKKKHRKAPVPKDSHASSNAVAS